MTYVGHPSRFRLLQYGYFKVPNQYQAEKLRVSEMERMFMIYYL